MTAIRLLRALGLGWLTWALIPGWFMRDAAFALAVVAAFIVVAVLLVRRRTRTVVRCSSDDVAAVPDEMTTPVPDALGWSR